MNANVDSPSGNKDVRQTVRFNRETYHELERRVERGEFESISAAIRAAVGQLVDGAEGPA